MKCFCSFQFGILRGYYSLSQGPDSLIIRDVEWSEIYLQVYQCQIHWRLELLLLSYNSTINTQLRCNFVAEKQTPPTTPLLTKPTSKTRSANSSSSIKFLNELSCCRPCGSVSATRVLRNAKYVALLTTLRVTERKASIFRCRSADCLHPEN